VSKGFEIVVAAGGDGTVTKCSTASATCQMDLNGLGWVCCRSERSMCSLGSWRYP